MSGLTNLTRHLRRSVDDRMAGHLQVSSWQDGVLRVCLDDPALVTRWRFLAPAVLRTLARVPELEGLREIRLSVAQPTGQRQTKGLAPDNSLRFAPVEALKDLARSTQDAGARKALEKIASAAAAAQGRRPLSS